MYNLYHEIMNQINNNEIKEIKFSIMNLVRKIKEMRIFSVENENQYNVLYLFANYLLYNFNK
jgi:protein tyrosine phosphatase